MTACGINNLSTVLSKKLDELITAHPALLDKANQEYEVHKEQVEKELNQFILDNLIYADGTISKFEVKTLLNCMKSKGLSDLDIDFEDLERHYRPQLLDKLSYLAIENWQLIFGSNTVATGKVRKWFKIDSIKYTLLDRSKNAPVHCIRTPQLLNFGLVRMKNELCKDIVKILWGDDLSKSKFQEDFEFFNPISGADYDSYKELMDSVGKLTLPSETTWDENNTKELRLFYDVFVLNNFDKLLDLELDDIIEKDDPDFGLLDHTQYRNGIKTEEEVHKDSDLAYENALDKISTTAKKIIESVPKVIVNGKEIIHTDATLSVSDLFQISGLILNQIIDYNLRHPEKQLDLFEDPLGVVKTILTDIYLGTTDIIHRGDEDNIKLQKQDRRLTAKLFGIAKSTALSLYFFMYDSPTKNKENGELDLRAISELDLRFGQLSGLNFEQVIVNEILKTVTPTYFTYDEDGLLIQNSGKTIANAILNRSQLSRHVFTLHNKIKSILQLGEFGSLENNKIYTWLKNLKDIPKEERIYDKLKKNPNFKELMRLLIGSNYNFSADDTFKELFLNRELGVIDKLFRLFDEIRKLIENSLTGSVQSLQSIVSQDLSLDTLLNSLKLNFGNLDSFAEILSPMYGTTPVTVIKDINGNSIPVYRLFSLAFADHHLIKQYKPLSRFDKIASTKNSGYIPLRNRSNFLVNHPEILSGTSSNNDTRNNMHVSSTGIKLTTGNESLNLDARKLSSPDLIIESFSADFLQLLGLRDDYGVASPLGNVLIGVLSDKTSILTKILNLNIKLNENEKGDKKSMSISELIKKDPNKIIELDRFYRLTSTLDLVDKILTNWKIILSKKGIDFNYDYSDNIKLSRVGLHLRNWNVWHSFDPTNSNWNQYKEKQESLFESLYQAEKDAIIELNTILKNHKLNVFELSDIAFLEGIEFVPELFWAKYNTEDGSTQMMFNRMLEYDLENLSTFDNWKAYQLANFEKFKNTEIKGRKLLDLTTSGSNNKSIIYQYFYDRRLNSDFTEAINSSGFNIYKDNKVDINELNKALQTSLAFQNFIRHLYLDLTVKEAYVDPDKAGNIVIDREIDSRIGATNKRNVNFGGSISVLMGNLINGVNKSTPVAIIDSYTELVFNLLGKTEDQDIFDGCSFMSPFEARMQYQSLADFTKVNTLKTLGTWISDYWSSLAKWAEFPITNAAIRDSKGCKFDLELVFEKMHNFSFDPNTNICSSFILSELKTLIPRKLTGKDCFFTDGLRFYKIIKLEYLGNNTYSRSIQEVDRAGNPIENTPISKSLPFTIENIYDIYKAFGGYRNMELLNGRLEWSENIMDLIYEIIIRNGKIKSSGYYNQDTVDQPLRNKFIHILATKSSIKRTWPNLNKSGQFETGNYLRSDDGQLIKPLNYFMVDLSMTGRQLESYHQSDGSEITEPTQALAALAENGFTYDLAKDIYDSLLNMILINGKDVIERSRLLKEGNWDLVALDLSRQIVLNTDFTGSMSEIDAIIDKFFRKAKQAGTPDKIILPLSVFSRDVTKLLVQTLNKDVIRRKYEASLAGVLNPTSNIKLVYNLGGKNWMYSDILNYLLDLNIDKQSISNYLLKLHDPILSDTENEKIKLEFLFKLAGTFINNPEFLQDFIPFISFAKQYNSEIYLFVTTGQLDQVFEFIDKYSTNRTVAEFFITYQKVNNKDPKKPFMLLKPTSPNEVQVLDTIVTKDGENITLSEIDLYQRHTMFNNAEFEFVNTSIPTDLKPQINQVTSENRTENEYNNVAAYANRTVQKLLSLVKKRKLDKLQEYGKVQKEECN